ncbi:hypothetical protein UFOVP71_20 [uncultured Caudovirales phage]|uniref:Uncharacterized protein n=1 Tax=uncultured Caudovirales phage TaxID=2100421 RepID=A0A6J5T9I9_9CAUD|nr:hypothetical protein UFOVP71_20 [uncultured Caudovirales phage]
MSKTVLEQALDHLLNKEEDKASALLHDYYVGIGRQVYEDIMADDIDFNDEDRHGIHTSVDEVEADLTEEGEDEEATADLETEMNPEEAEPVDADAGDMADAMMDVESALAKLKAEFEQMVGGEEMGAEEAPTDDFASDTGEEGEEQFAPESIEEALELQKVANPSNTEGQAAGAGTGYANGVTGTTNTTSPVAKRNPMMARPATNFAGGAAQGVPSGTTPAKAPASKDLGMTTRPAVSKVAKPGVAPGREAGSSPSDLPRG